MFTKAVLAGLLVIGLFQGTAEAQDVARFYLMPKKAITIGGVMPALVPKYVNPVDLPGVSYSAMDFGNEDTMLVGADVTNAQHTAIAVNADVIAIPQNLNNTINATALSTVRDRIDGLKIPIAHLTTASTYRQAIGIVGRMFQILQRFDAIQAQEGRTSFFGLNITLSSTVNELRAAVRKNLMQAAQELGLDTSTITGSMTIRQAFRILIDQMPAFTLAGESF